MDRFHLMSVFVAVAEEEGFAAAARRLRMSPPAVTRAIVSLEESLGIKLLNRTTRFVRVTEAGQRYLEDVRRILADVEAADEAAVGINTTPSGDLSVTAPTLFGKRFVLPGVLDYLERFPQTRVAAVFLDRVVNLLEEGFDVGIRIGELSDSSMRALQVGSVRTVVVGAPDYLKKHGMPTSLEELNEHTIVTVASGGGSQNWRFEDNGNIRSIKVRPRLTLTTNEATVSATESGFGLSRLLSYQVAQEVSKGSLEIVLEEFEPTPKPIHILHREGRIESAKVRGFVDVIAERLRADRTLNQ